MIKKTLKKHKFIPRKTQVRIADDWVVNRGGDIRYVGDTHDEESPSYTTALELHRWLQEMADDLPTDDTVLSIIDENPSVRVTDNIITLLGDYNIDDTAAEYIYNGSITQNNGDEIYANFQNLGNCASNLTIIQNDTVLPNDYWNSSQLFSDTSSFTHNFILPIRRNGEDIDNRRVTFLLRNLGYTYSDFTIDRAFEGTNITPLFENVELNYGT
jgi:hypothetical protein